MDFYMMNNKKNINRLTKKTKESQYYNQTNSHPIISPQLIRNYPEIFTTTFFHSD